MQTYLIYATDGKDKEAATRRMKMRPLHFQMASALKADRHFITGGAMLDDEGNMIGSMMLVQFENKEKLQEWLDKEPYIRGGVWEEIAIHPFRIADVP